ncbi:MAG: dTDP-4-dehydrorhamnose reductase [Pseudomonadota bacterium]
MRIVILGCRGQLGSDCLRVFEKENGVVCAGHQDVDIADPEQVREVIGSHKPEVVINCAAFTRVDLCETEIDTAFRINAMGPGIIAGACRKSGALMVHVSTDYVFDGNREPPLSYCENDATDPLSVYGRTKLEGEIRVTAESPDNIVLRTAWLYGIGGSNFLKTMLRLTLNKPGTPIKVVNDQFGSPTWTLRLALQMEKLIKAGGRGLYHATSEGYCSWYELACYFLKQMEVAHTLVPCSTAEYPLPAKRPANSILENARLKRANINRMTGWRDGVDRFVSSFRQDLLAECSRIS